MGSHKTKIDDQLDHFGYADAKKEHGPLKFQITVRTNLLRCHLHNIQYSNPNNKILRYDIKNVKLTTAQFPNPDWRPRECSTRAHRLLLSRCPSIVNCYAHCPQSRQRLASTDFCVEKSRNLNFCVFKSIKISPCFPISSV